MLLSPWNSPDKNIGVGSHSLLQGIFPNQGWNLDRLHCRQIFFFYRLSFHACVQSLFSHVWIFVTLWTVLHQAPLSMGFSRQESWSRLPCPPPGDLPDPGIEHVSLTSPALAGRFFTTNATWEPHLSLQGSLINITDLLLNSICFNSDLLSHVPWFYYLEIYFPLFLNTHKVAISIYTIKCLFRYLSI